MWALLDTIPQCVTYPYFRKVAKALAWQGLRLTSDSYLERAVLKEQVSCEPPLGTGYKAETEINVALWMVGNCLHRSLQATLWLLLP